MEGGGALEQVPPGKKVWQKLKMKSGTEVP